MSDFEDPRNAAIVAYQAERGKWRVPQIPDNIAQPLVSAAIDSFLAKLRETHTIVPREPLIEKLGRALAQQGHSCSADDMVTYEDDDGHECESPYWRFHEFDREAESIINKLSSSPPSSELD